MAHRMFQTKIGFDLSVIRARPGQVGDFVASHLKHAAYVRGIQPETVHEVQGTGLSTHYIVAGPQNDDQGWDADGAPIAEYPGKSMAWPEKLDGLELE